MATTHDDLTQATYLVNGLVVDRISREPVANAQVELRERDTHYHDILGQTVTNPQGGFTVAFEPEDWGDAKRERAPDLFFRVFIDGQEVLNTIEQPMMNVPPGRINVTLELERPVLPRAAPDRVSVEQLIKAADWWQESDFKGVAREAGGKLGLVGQLLGKRASSKLASWDFEPVRPSATKDEAVVGQTVQQAQSALAAQQVSVAEVKPAQTSGRQLLRTLPDVPLRLRANDRVVLHEENGVVRYYTLVPDKPAANIDQQAVAALEGDVQQLKSQTLELDTLRGAVAELRSGSEAQQQRIAEESEVLRQRTEEVAALRRELALLREVNAEKDVQIGRLRGDVDLLRTSQDSLVSRLPISRLEALERDVALVLRPRGGTRPPTAAPGGAANEHPAEAQPAASARLAQARASAEKPAAVPTKKPAAAAAVKPASSSPGKTGRTGRRPGKSGS